MKPRLLEPYRYIGICLDQTDPPIQAADEDPASLTGVVGVVQHTIITDDFVDLYGQTSLDVSTVNHGDFGKCEERGGHEINLVSRPIDTTKVPYPEHYTN